MPNRLAQTTSPYLRQHADNPVDWYPWGPEAFAKARTEEKPIFLSIGYSTCHWCHVMAHECFEDPAIAAVLNEHFVSIKVDREERPDVDKVYMSYVQALTGQGGWPLSAWLTPDLRPFYGGTYFPPEDRHGRPGFPNLLRALAYAWRNEREKIFSESARVMAALESGTAEAAPGAAVEKELAGAAAEAWERGFRHYRESFDSVHGGFGGAPKFPRASNLVFLSRFAVHSGPTASASREALALTVRTLRQMARGGIHDQVGGGFHRYSVDEEWFVPHFEKMLYDQAQIAVNAIEAWQATGDERQAWLVRDILDYVLRDLAHPGGGFYSAEDADSVPPEAPAPAAGQKPHAVEGAFYIWSRAEIEAVLPAPDAALFCGHFGVTAEGNVPGARDPFGEFKGKNILAQVRSLDETAQAAGLSPAEASDRLVAGLETLRAVRAQRPRPGLDDKILTAWNGLMISAFARAAALPAEALADRQQAYLAAATSAAEFVGRELFDPARGVLYRSWREGRGPAEGFAEDYAFFIQGLLDLQESSYDPRWLQQADRLQTKMDELFWDEPGGYFNSAAGATDLILRLKDDYDGAEPAASSVAVLNLLRLGAIFDEGGTVNRRERARRTLAAFAPRWSAAPQALPQMASALDLALEPPRHVVLAGDPDREDFQALAAVMHGHLGPRRSLIGLTGPNHAAWLAQRVPWLAGLGPRDGRAAAYVCENFACQAPVATPEELWGLLWGRPAPG